MCMITCSHRIFSPAANISSQTHRPLSFAGHGVHFASKRCNWPGSSLNSCQQSYSLTFTALGSSAFDVMQAGEFRGVNITMTGRQLRALRCNCCNSLPALYAVYHTNQFVSAFAESDRSSRAAFAACSRCAAETTATGWCPSTVTSC